MPRISTFKKIRGYLKSALLEAPLASETRTFNLDRLFQKKQTWNPGKKFCLSTNQLCDR